MVKESEVWAQLKRVIDPELGVDLVNLGLIYEVAVDGSDVCIVMTLTTPGCPLSGSLPKAVQRAVAILPGVTQTDVVLTFNPPWGPERITPEGRQQLEG